MSGPVFSPMLIQCDSLKVASHYTLSWLAIFVGYYGDEVVVNKKDLNLVEREKYDKGWKENAFNSYVSDMISLDRPLTDIRDKQYVSLEIQPN